MATATTPKPDVNEVSRSAVAATVERSVEKAPVSDKDKTEVPHTWYAFPAFDGKAEETDLVLNDKTGKALKVLHFPKIRFDAPVGEDDTPEKRSARMVQFFEQNFPPLKDKEGNVIRNNDALDIIAAHVSYSMDLTMRNSLRQKEAAILEGPDKEMLKQAQKLAVHKGISIDEALERVKLAWG